VIYDYASNGVYLNKIIEASISKAAKMPVRCAYIRPETLRVKG
jgi:hypothetical protein